MKKVMILIFVCFLFIQFTGVAGAAPIQWSNNGHWYEIIDKDIDWADAEAEAKTLSLSTGEIGHLVTITSVEEGNWIHDILAGGGSDGFNALNLHWIGAFQADGASEPDGGWGWSNNEAWAYTNWFAGEPNNSPDNENAVLFSHDFSDWGVYWNDVIGENAASGYVVEYEGSPIPEPNTFLLVGIGLLGLARIKRKQLGAI